MTLTSRLSLFFLVTLALVLGGFSTALYFLVRAHLHQQVQERLDAALNTLVAAAEVTPDGLEWEPRDRHVRLGPAAHADQVVWLVSDGEGEIVDQSKQSGAADFLAEASQALRSSREHAKPLDRGSQSWQCSQRYLESGAATGASTSSPPSGQKDDGRKYPALFITAGVSLAPAQAALRQLVGVSLGLSVGIWVLAVFAGRFICRRALLPVSRMALAAREMLPDDLARRLPTAANGDELEELGRAFNDLLDRLQQSFERQKRFTGDASHQLRTPVAAMIGQIEVALRRERSTDEYRGVLTTLQEKAGHLRRIVEALLFLARADSETQPPRLERVNLHDWLPRHLQTWSEHGRGNDIVFESDKTGPIYAEVHPVLLGELVSILIENACKFSEPATPIRVRLHHEEQHVLVRVEDRGCGITEADLPNIFLPFYRTANHRPQGVAGAGLGLSIARRLAETMNGTLAVTSHVGQGSCFTLVLPVDELA